MPSSIASGLPLAGHTVVQLECHVAIAGWSIRKEHADLFAAEGSHLQRYASRFAAVEINSSFYRSHKRGHLRAMGRRGAGRLPLCREDAKVAHA